MSPRRRPRILLVTPALAAANNGNWQTVRRWSRWLGERGPVALTAAWLDPDAPADAALMIALHARRSAASIVAWRAAHPQCPLVVVLTGTDLNRDIALDAEAQPSLALADRLVVLNDLGLATLPPALRAKARVVLQSAPARAPRPKTGRHLRTLMVGHLRALMVGHLRAEKDPRTAFAAARLLAGRADFRLDQVGGALDAALGAEAAALMRYRCPGATQRRRPGGAEAQDAVARRNHAPGDEPT